MAERARIPALRVVLLANYHPDAQESMQRYAISTAVGLRDVGLDVRVVRPPLLAGRLARSAPARKWLGYLDKYVFFLAVLVGVRVSERARGHQPVFHICDHSNAPWSRVLPRHRTIVTCHDVLAIRGARGHADAEVLPSRAGRLLQAQILRSLLAARWVLCDSTTTLEHLEQLAAEEPGLAFRGARRVQLPVPYNADFSPLSEDERRARLSEFGLEGAEPFILHVGSALARKNRVVLPEMSVDSRHPWEGLICFAGAPLDAALWRVIQDRGVADRVIETGRVNHDQLVALYQSCAAFVFPSLSEGFGWPIIEAQRAGAPVIASARPPLPEVGGDGAIYCDPADASAFAGALASLEDSDLRRQLVTAGLANAARFAPVAIHQRYAEVYREMLSS